MAAFNGRDVFTERLHLRRPVEADASSVISIVADSEVARRLARIPHPYTESDFRFFMDLVVPCEPTWGVVLRGTSELIGLIGLALHSESQSAELGFYFGRQFWGQGFATEAGQAIVRAALDVTGYARLTSGYYADNSASGRVLTKLGFKLIGYSSRPCLAEGRDKPSIEMELRLTS